MKFSTLSSYFARLEKETSRLKMTAILAELFKETSADEVDKVCYLSLGTLAPKYQDTEFNMAEKMVQKAVAIAVGQPLEEVAHAIKEIGDMGDYLYKLKAQNSKLKTKGKNSQIDIGTVFHHLLGMAQDKGAGSVDRKINRLAQLLGEIDSLSAKYVVRMILAKLRLGFSSMTILDSLSWSVAGDKSRRTELEKAYNIQADIGQIAQVYKTGGMEAIAKIQPKPGIPVRAAKAERLKDAGEILEKLHGQCLLEPKFDGFRLMMHVDHAQKEKTAPDLTLFGGSSNNEYLIRLFSRNMDNMTAMFPDVAAALQKLPVQSAILDGEAIAFNPQTGKFLPFQETVQRKRKYDIVNKAKEIPLKVFIFDLLFLNGESLIVRPFFERRRQLEALLTGAKSDVVLLTKQQKVTRPTQFERFFKAVQNEGLEGLVAKKANAPYRAGIRDHTWVKYKVAMRSELADTIDCVVMGYYFGKGKRTSFGIGAFLVGVTKQVKSAKLKVQSDYEIVTVSKIGTGLTDKQWRELYLKCQMSNVKCQKKPENYIVNKNLYPDVWLEPKIVVEIEADTITKSPIHSAGLALRFPRLKRFREDKEMEDATSLDELSHMFARK